jgi:hypothetical protein
VGWHQLVRKEPLIQAMWWGQAAGKTASVPNKPQWPALVVVGVLGAALFVVVAMAPEAPSYY